MNEMITFSTFILQSLAQFLGTPPVFYLFGLICLLFVTAAFKKLIS